MKSSRGVLFFLLAVLPGCHALAPAGFWAPSPADLISGQFSDQGPWGGVRWVQWVSPLPRTFEPQAIVDFAQAHGWSCEVPHRYATDQLTLWQYSGRPVFPLHFGPGDLAPITLDVRLFPRHITEASSVYPCKSGWIRVEPGTGTASDALGYVQINESGTRLAVYHLWGEI